MCTRSQLAKLTPALHGEERMRGGRNNRMTESGPQPPHGLYSTWPDRKNSTLSQAQIIVAGNRGFQLDMTRYDFIDAYPSPRVRIHNPGFTNNTFRETVFTKTEHLLVNALRE